MTVVTGSAAADLDSIVASVAYAYLLDREGETAGPVFPYLPIPRADLPLRTEVVRLFDREGVREGILLFSDDVDLVKLLEARESELVLVDDQGNDLATPLCERIAEVIDHHRLLPREAVEDSVGRYFRQPLRRRIVEPVGSACTLVAEQILQRESGILDRQLATLLLAAVLLDTVNLDPQAGRVTDKDRKIAELLIQAGSVDPAGLYEELVRARSDVEGRSSRQLLGRDYKEGSSGGVRFGMSSVPLLLDCWNRRDRRIAEAISGFLEEKELDLLVVFLYRHGRVFKRQLVFCGAEEKLVTDVASRLAGPLGLTQMPMMEDEKRAVQSPRRDGGRAVVVLGFAQGNSGESRKRIEPRIREVLENR